MPHTPPLVQKAEAFCTDLLRTRLPASLVFHNYHHTAAVAAAAFEIGTHSGLTAEELHMVVVAAWFHDTGYCCRYKGHEESSKQFATSFLLEQGVAPAFQKQVLACIEATKVLQRPATLAEQVLRDADMSHLGKDFFPATSLRLKKEIESVQRTTIPDREWHRQNIAFLEQHMFFTPYAQEHYTEQKNKNIQQERLLLANASAG